MTMLLAWALLAGPLGVPATPTPSPTPPSEIHLIAALESVQNDGRERTALFDDGTLVHLVTYKGRTVSDRQSLSAEQREVIQTVCREALTLREESETKWDVLATSGSRRLTLTVGAPGGRERRFTFDDLTPLPLALGRARGALEDLRSRFYRDKAADTYWDPSGVKEGDLLRRRADGSWYRVVRGDTFERNLELAEVAGMGQSLFTQREQLPKLFEDPARVRPPVPSAAPR